MKLESSPSVNKTTTKHQLGRATEEELSKLEEEAKNRLIDLEHNKAPIPRQYRQDIIRAYAQFIHTQDQISFNVIDLKDSQKQIFEAFLKFRKNVSNLLGVELRDEIFGTEQEVIALYQML